MNLNIDKLNEQQRAAVLKTDGPIMILAGAGSGKTRTLVTRISYLLEEIRVSPFQILALTFSNKAAKEMRDRVGTELGMDVGALQITTFHSFCAQVLRNEANHLGLSRNFTIYDDSESNAVIKALMKRRGVSSKEVSHYDISYFIDHIKNVGHYIGRDFVDPEIDTQDPNYDYYLEYESEVFRANAVDFGGLITGVIQLFEKFPDVLKRYQNRFRYILVDEYQDTNRAQFHLVKMLAEHTRNICVVGDEDQSIYSWRGADIRNILDFERVYPDATLLKLEQNYRSSKNIIEAATQVISKNVQRKGKMMWTDNPEGESIQVVECGSDKQESEFIAGKIKELSAAGEVYKDMAIFYRSNSQSRMVEDQLRTYRIPYRVIGGVKFYDRKEIKDVLAYLRLVVNPKDNLALSRIINVPARGIGATTLRNLEEEAMRTSQSLWEILSDSVDKPEKYTHIRLSANTKSAIRSFVSLIQECMLLEDKKIKPVTIYEKVLNESGYQDSLRASKDYEAMARLENLEELSNALTQFEESSGIPTLTGFLETITLDTSTSMEAESAADMIKGEVSLMTVHGAKGLEFPYVFVTGCEENLFPSYKSMESGEQAIEEERRLFYVAMTRAMKTLFIIFAQGRMLFGQLRFNGPSRFIMEIPNEYYHWNRLAKNTEDDSSFQSKHYNSDRFDDDFGDNSYIDSKYDDGPVVYATKFKIEAKYKKGAKIAHNLYGEGVVLDSEGSGTDEKVTIKFRDGSRKKFMVKFAPLTLI